MSFDQKAFDRQHPILPNGESAPTGTFSSAYLVTDYFGMENRLRAPIKWRAKRGQNALLRRNRRRLAELREAFGLNYIGRQFVAE